MSKKTPETSQNDGTIVSGSIQNKKKVFGASIGMGLPLIVLVTIGVIAGLLLSGYMAVIWKRPSQHIGVTGLSVCGDDVVSTYNAAMLYKKRSGSSQDTIDEAGLKNLVADVKHKSGYETDPTCQTIVLMAAIHNKDYQTAKKTYGVLEELHGKHLYVDSNLNTGGSLSTYESLIDSLSPSNQGVGNQGPQGGA